MTSAITLEQHDLIRAAFESVIDTAMPPARLGQLEFFTDEEEQYIQHEVDRMLWEPILRNAGDKEREDLRRLRGFLRDESLVGEIREAIGIYAAAIEKCLPKHECVRKGNRWVRPPGSYYSRRSVTAKNNRNLFAAAMDLKNEAVARKDRGRKWLAEYILNGAPRRLSNFKMECLYLLRGADGDVTRLVRFMNTKGEVGKGHEMCGANKLPNEMYAGSEKFRQLIQSKGNFSWGCEGGAGNTELQLLQMDVTEEAAYREVELIQYCGWHEIEASEPEEIQPGREILHGLWFHDECAIAPDGSQLKPDADGIIWFEGVGYALSLKGRELDFIQGRPKLRPELSIDKLKFNTDDWEQAASDTQTIASASEMFANNPLGAFYREMCRRFCDTAGGMEGWLSVGAMLGYAAAPEIYAKQKNFPSMWVSGQMGSGKSSFVAWLMAIQGFTGAMGMGLISKNVTAVGIACQLENYSNLALWLDEFRENQISPDKEPMLRDSYNRQLAGKWTADGVQRKIRTMTLVSGESTTSDAAMRSRYPHVLISEQKRVGNHYDWMQEHSKHFVLFWREILTRRAEFVALVLEAIESWMNHPDVKHLPSRERVTHSVCYAAFAAAARIFSSHSEEEIKGYRQFLAAHAVNAAEDVASDTNVNVFIQDLIVAYNAGAIPNECFRVEGRQMEFLAGSPNQGRWVEYKLFVEPQLAISALQIYLKKGNLSVALRTKDLRDQLSRYDFWIKAGKESNYRLNKRFGAKGSQACRTAWGFLVDKHPLGTRKVTDEEHEAALLPPGDRDLAVFGPQFIDGDPRKGPLFSIIEGVLEAERKADL